MTQAFGGTPPSSGEKKHNFCEPNGYIQISAAVPVLNAARERRSHVTALRVMWRSEKKNGKEGRERRREKGEEGKAKPGREKGREGRKRTKRGKRKRKARK